MGVAAMRGLSHNSFAQSLRNYSGSDVFKLLEFWAKHPRPHPVGGSVRARIFAEIVPREEYGCVGAL